MGAQLISLMEQIEKEQGFQVACKVVMLTGITKEDAKNMPDSPEQVQKVQSAIDQIKGGI